MKELVIAEKPSVGRDIAKVLGCTKRGDGYLYSEKYIVSWAVGHLVTLCEPEDYDSALKKWNKNTLPIIPSTIRLKAIPNTKKQLDILKGLMNSKEVNHIICATDSGREGELIFRYIYDIVKCKKPFSRLWISSMTDSAIKEGFKKMKDGAEYDNLYLSAKCRSEADWLVGINASRAFTIKYNTLLSIGRVQTPTLHMIVEKQKEIDAFQVKEYWEVKAKFGTHNGTWIDEKTNETKILEKEKAKEISQKVSKKQGIISKIEKEDKKQLPYLLYDLTELQRDSNKKYGFSAQKTLSIAQDLYEKRKVITYPRTDSRYLSNDMIPKLNNVLIKIKNSPQYDPFVSYILSLDKLPITKRIVDNAKITDHHAIIPTDAKANISSLSADEQKIYDLVVRRFISVFYPPYLYSITKIISLVEGESFLTKGTTIKQLGFMELYKDDKPEKNKKKTEEDELLPDVKKGENVFLEKAEVVTKKTQPPKPYTEGTLLSAMENAGRFVEDEDLKEHLKDSGLGTPATRAAIIERMIFVGYLQRKGKALIPTEKAMKLMEVVPIEMKSPETTGKWEKGLSSISKGKMDSNKFMGSIIRYVNYIVESSNKSNIAVHFPEEQHKGKITQKNMGVCPKCNEGVILENTKGFYCSRWKQDCKFTIWKNALELYGYNLEEKIIKKFLKEKVVKDLDIILPQTNERCKADLKLVEDFSGRVELINLKRLDNSPVCNS